MMYNSRATGNEKEALAADHLAGRGYEILCRNFRVASGEIDIVAKHDGYIGPEYIRACRRRLSMCASRDRYVGLHYSS